MRLPTALLVGLGRSNEVVVSPFNTPNRHLLCHCGTGLVQWMVRLQALSMITWMADPRPGPIEGARIYAYGLEAA